MAKAQQEPPASIWTVGAIARSLGTTADAVRYIVRTRGIRPAASAPNLRVFSDDAVARIKREHARIRETRGL